MFDCLGIMKFSIKPDCGFKVSWPSDSDFEETGLGIAFLYYDCGMLNALLAYTTQASRVVDIIISRNVGTPAESVAGGGT